jgi:DNA-binding MarR family transcriptional regulator
MTTTAPTANGRTVALAHYAGRALLEIVLARHDLTFEQSVTLRGVVVAGGAIGRDELAGGIAGALQTDEASVGGVVDELAAAKLVEEDPAEAGRVRVTAAGREVYEVSTAEAAEITKRLYDGVPDEDLAVVHRVLTLVTERANAELGAARG